MAFIQTTGVSTEEALRQRARAKKQAQLKAARARAEDFLEYAIRDEETGAVIRNADFHREWQKFLRENRRATLIAPVEHGKTQQVLGKVLHLLGNNPSLRIALISNTAEQAQKLLRSVRTHIEENARVREVFPNLKPSTRDADPWHQSAITVERKTTAKDPSIQAHGVFGPIVGARLDVIVLDDVLDFENTRTEEQRKKLIEWFDTTVFTRATKHAQIFAIGTPWHPDDFLHNLEARPGFSTRRYCAVENPDDPRPKWRPIWPRQWPRSRLIERERDMAETVFSRKYLCRVRMDATARFKEEWLRRMVALGRGLSFFPESPKAQGGVRKLRCFTGVDLGVGQGEENALTVLFTIAQRDDGRRMVVNIESGHWTAPEIIDRLESHYRRYDATIMVESNGAQKFIVDMALDKSIPVTAFHTGANKWDPEWGVESLAVEMRNMRWVLPSGSAGEIGQLDPEAQAWLRECLYFNPSEHTGDRLMASWLAREAARRFDPSPAQRVDTQRR